MASQIILFANFYYQTYHVKPNALKTLQNNSGINEKLPNGLCIQNKQESDMYMKINLIENNSNFSPNHLNVKGSGKSKYTDILEGDNNLNNANSFQNPEKPRFRKRRPSDN